MIDYLRPDLTHTVPGYADGHLCHHNQTIKLYIALIILPIITIYFCVFCSYKKSPLIYFVVFFMVLHIILILGFILFILRAIPDYYIITAEVPYCFVINLPQANYNKFVNEVMPIIVENGIVVLEALAEKSFLKDPTQGLLWYVVLADLDNFFELVFPIPTPIDFLRNTYTMDGCHLYDLETYGLTSFKEYVDRLYEEALQRRIKNTI